MMRTSTGRNPDWLDRYKKKIILGIIAILTLTIAVTMMFIACTMRSRLLQESKVRAEELGTVIHSSLEHLMQARNPGRMQSTLIAIGKEETSLVGAFIIDNHGKVAYSSREKDLGTTLDLFTDVSCRGCHIGPVTVSHDTTTSITVDGQRVLRYVHIIENRPSCHGCHAPSVRINGKLIIDRSLEPTYALVKAVVLIITASGLVSLAVLVPFLWRFLTKGVDTYINEIRMKSAELTVLYGIVERLSTTIELEGLKGIIIEIISEAMGADEIDVVMPSEYRELGAMVWTKSGNEIERKKVEPGSSLEEVIHAWSDGRIADHAVVNDGKEIRMPIVKGKERLALIVVRSAEGKFEGYQLALVRAMANHIAVAFENAMLYHMAITDELTGLFSSRHFRQAIAKKYSLYQEFGEKMTLLMIDIDNFKKINDTYGHPAGDAILKDVGRCIMSSIRDDDMGFRYGGEEFAVILPVTDVAAGKAVANRMRKLIESYPFKADQHVLQVTVSIGVASWPASAETIREIITEADKALYEAKHGGKNRVVARRRER